MSGIPGQRAEVRGTLTIKRKATGKVEKFEIVGSTKLTPEQLKEALKNGSDPLRSRS